MNPIEIKPILEVKRLSMYFSAKRRGVSSTVKAVDDVSFDVYPGETFGLVGESGCGKTTAGRAIIRLYTPTAGEVSFGGRLISGRLDSATRRFITDNIAMIFQDPISSLNPRMTVQEIVGEGLKVRGVKDADERRRKVVQMLEHVGLQADHADRYPHEFSGGQRQRIGIARALIIDPQMVIADEPVSALDVSVQAQVINLLNGLKEEMGLTIVFIAHNLSVVKYFSDRIGVMYFGKLVELADSEELFRHPLHPYTKALLSAIPQPDPRSERWRKRIHYDPKASDYREGNRPSYHQVAEGHLVYCSDAEFETYMRDY
jgi:ABC-type oligopeptide transport system ATPase subunit